MDLCRTIIVAMLALALLQISERLSYDGARGLRLAAMPGAHAQA